MTVPLGSFSDGQEINLATIGQKFLTPMNQALATMLTDDGGWQPLTLTGAWVPYAGGYPSPSWRAKGGKVYLQGMVKSGTGAITTLPVGARPSATLIFNTQAGNGAARMDLTSAGVLSLTGYFLSGTNGYVDLGSVNFYPD